MVFNLKASCGSFIGTLRENNEDNLLFADKYLSPNNRGIKKPLFYETKTDENIVFAVFDGLGGASYGEEASGCAAESFLAETRQLKDIIVSGKEFFINACQHTNQKICKMMDEKNVRSMGTTVASLFLSNEEIYACNIGDSKIYRLRDDCLVQLSEDHTDEKILKAIGSDKKPSLLQYLGIHQSEMTIEPFISKGELQKNDIYVLCSDGVTDTVSIEELYSRLKSESDISLIVKLILDDVELKNGEDNATLILIKVE